MTDWLEELMDQVEEWESAGTGMELLALNLPRGQIKGYVPQDRRQDGTTQTTGQGEELPGERTGGAAFEREQLIFGRTVPENGGEETGGTPRGSYAARDEDGTEPTNGALPADIPRGRERRQTPEGELYRRLTRAGWDSSGSPRTERTVVVEQQSVGTPSLTVDQLDRAVRRDSRRYDGGMELY